MTDGEKERDKESELVKENKEKPQLNQELNVLEEKAKRLRNGKKSIHTYIKLVKGIKK